MIKTIPCSELDKQQIAEQESSEHVTSLESKSAKTDPVDYSQFIVTKPWGYEFLVFENEHVAIWMLHLVRQRKTSVHCHPNKKTSLVLLSGEATFSNLETQIKLAPMDGLIIAEGAFHSTEASSDLPIKPMSENGIWVMEIESPPMKTDLVRMKDAYGRKGKQYEGKRNWVFNSDIFHLPLPKPQVYQSTYFNDCRFTVSHGLPEKLINQLSSNAMVSIVGHGQNTLTDNPKMNVGELSEITDFLANTKQEPLDKYTFLIMEKGPLMRVSDYIFSKISDLGVSDVFTVSGGTAMHLLDSLGINSKLSHVCTHHEQTCAMAAETYATVKNVPGVALVTSGPGGTNAITGVAGAWLSSVPTITLSGQVVSFNLIGDSGIRQYGVQEADIISQVTPITKYAVCVKDPKEIRYHMEKAIHLATTGKPGPVWLDIPLDVQGKLIDPLELEGYVPEEQEESKEALQLADNVANCLAMLRDAERPVLLLGFGIRLAGGEALVQTLIQKLGVPVITSWNGSDLVAFDEDNYVGSAGIFGDRPANFAVQNSDLVLSVGCRLSVPQIGYNHSQFARAAKKIVVDIDQKELEKPSIKPDLPIQADAKAFIEELLKQFGEQPQLPVEKWREKCSLWKQKYPVILPEYATNKEKINSFHFIDVLSAKLPADATVITDMGTSFTCTMQSFKTKLGQRLYTSSGMASMGFGLPGAIGACLGNDRKETILINGDGGLQMNLQEFQTVLHYNLPIKMFILNNNGYMTIRATQQNHFGRFVGSDIESGVSCPDTIALAKAYGISSLRIENQQQLAEKIEEVLAHEGPFICEIMMPENQALIPRISSVKRPDGTVVSKPLEDLYPFLDEDEFLDNMIIDPVEILANTAAKKD